MALPMAELDMGAAIARIPAQNRRSRVCCGDIQAAKVEPYARVLSKSPWNLSATTERRIA
jgi:hypothetical protein